MKTVNVAINLYQFDELSEEAKAKAIEEHRDFLLRVTCVESFDFPDDYVSTMIEIQEKDEPIIENIRINEYIYFSTGDLAHCTTYTGKHPKSGITEFNFMGSVYQI